MHNHGIKWTRRFQNTTSTRREAEQCDPRIKSAPLLIVSLIAKTSATADAETGQPQANASPIGNWMADGQVSQENR